MPPLKTYRLFISHAWTYNAEYYRLVSLLDNANNFSWRNYSVPEHDPADANNTSKLKTALQNQMRPTQAVLIISGMYAAYSEWIQYRGFLPPARWRFSPPRFEPSRLRMRHIIRRRVVVPAIQSAPVATHSVATIAHLAFSLAGTILIPDCAPPQGLSPALFPQPPPAPIHSNGRSRP